MFMARMTAFGMLCLAGSVTMGAPLAAQAPTEPTFEVVSIRPNASGPGVVPLAMDVRPDGSFSATNVPVTLFLTMAFRFAVAAEMEGLPGWVSAERFDVTATTGLTSAPPPDEWAAMLRAMLADRFRLVAHIEKREVPVYALVLARSDGRLGPRLRPSEVDCQAQAAATRAAGEQAGGTASAPPRPSAPDPSAPVPPCTTRTSAWMIEGDMTMEYLATMLRSAAGRYIVDRTGLEGSHRLTLEFDSMAGALGPGAGATLGQRSSLFTALEEQLGLRLVDARTEREILVVDRLERPTEN